MQMAATYKFLIGKCNNTWPDPWFESRTSWLFNRSSMSRPTSSRWLIFSPTNKTWPRQLCYLPHSNFIALISTHKYSFRTSVVFWAINIKRMYLRSVACTTWPSLPYSDWTISFYLFYLEMTDRSRTMFFFWIMQVSLKLMGYLIYYLCR